MQLNQAQQIILQNIAGLLSLAVVFFWVCEFSRGKSTKNSYILSHVLRCRLENTWTCFKEEPSKYFRYFLEDSQVGELS